MDGADVSVEGVLPSKELPTITTLERLPLLVDVSAVAEKMAGLGERLMALGTDHSHPQILLDISLGARSWHHLGPASVHPALDLAGQLPTVPAQVLIKELNSGEGGAAVRTC